MKVNIVLYVYGGIPQDPPEIYLDKAKANARYEQLIRENDLDPEDPHDEDNDLYLYEDVDTVE